MQQRCEVWSQDPWGSCASEPQSVGRPHVTSLDTSNRVSTLHLITHGIVSHCTLTYPHFCRPHVRFRKCVVGFKSSEFVRSATNSNLEASVMPSLYGQATLALHFRPCSELSCLLLRCPQLGSPKSLGSKHSCCH